MSSFISLFKVGLHQLTLKLIKANYNNENNKKSDKYSSCFFAYQETPYCSIFSLCKALSGKYQVRDYLTEILAFEILLSTDKATTVTITKLPLGNF